MIDEIRKSVASILYERVSSPLYGTFILSWSICNWKIVYLTLFINDTEIPTGQTKIDYIIANFLNNPCSLYLYPILLTIGFIAVMPLLSNSAFWISQKYRQWRIEKKNEIEKKTLITREQYDAIREEIARKDADFRSTLAKVQDESSEAAGRVKTLNDQIVQRNNDAYRFKVLHASYGSRAAKWANVTSNASQQIQPNQGGTLQVNNFSLGCEGDKDPAPGHWKELILVYQNKGEIFSISAIEDDSINLTVSTDGIPVLKHGKNSQYHHINDAIIQKQNDVGSHSALTQDEPPK